VLVVLTEFEFESDSFSFEYRSGTTRIFYQISLSDSYPGNQSWPPTKENSNVFGQVCLSLCLSVLFVLKRLISLTYKLHFCTQVCLQNM